MSIIRGRAGWRTSFPNQNKWPGQQKVNGAKPSIFLRDGGVGGWKGWFGPQTNPLPQGKQDASALLAHLNGSKPLTTTLHRILPFQTRELITFFAPLPLCTLESILHNTFLMIKPFRCAYGSSAN